MEVTSQEVNRNLLFVSRETCDILDEFFILSTHFIWMYLVDGISWDKYDEDIFVVLFIESFFYLLLCCIGN